MKLSQQLALLALLVPAAVHAADVPFERRLPDRISGFVSIPDFGAFKERFVKTSYGRMLDDPQIATFRSQVEKVIRTAATRDNVLPSGIEIEDLLEVVSGEVALAATLPKNGSASLIFSLEFGESLDTVEKLIDEISDKAVEEGWEEGVVEFQGSSISTFAGPADDTRPEQVPNTLALVIEESTLIVSTSVELCQDVLDRRDGTADGSLATNEVFRHVIDSTSDRNRIPGMTWYLSIADLIQSAFASADPTNMLLNVARGNIGRVGILEWRGMGGTFDMATDGFDSISRTCAWIDDPVTGVLSVFTFPVDDLVPPPWVPADSAMYITANWDIERAYNSVETLWDTIMGRGSFSAGIQKLAADENGPGINIKLDVVDILDGRQHLLQASLPEDAGDEESGAVVVAMEVTDTEKAEQLLDRIDGQPGSPLESRTYRDTKIWSLETGVAFAVAHDCLLFSSTVAQLESVIRADPDITSLADDKDFQHSISRMPPRVSLMGVQQSVQQMRMIYNLIRTYIPAGNDGPDPSTLPEFEAIKHYFLTGVSYAVPNAQGFEYVTYTLDEDVSR